MTKRRTVYDAATAWGITPDAEIAAANEAGNMALDGYLAMKARAEAAEARVAELAAATAWRPVTEEPPSLGYYLTVDFYGAYGICYYENGEWQSFDYSGYQPTGWRPLPPPPDAATMEPTP